MTSSTHSRIRRFTAVLSFAALAVSTAAHAQKTYFIDEGTDFTNGNPCDIADVNDITSSLKTALDADSWSGSRYTNQSSWPQDFFETCSTTYGSGGLDATYGDTGSLAVFAGHGSPHGIYFPTYHNNRCMTDFTSNMRLGAMSGAKAVFGMWLACEVIQSAELGSNMYQWLRQQASWQSSISIGDNEPRDFYNATSAKTNADAWLDQMSTGGRDAIISTFDETSGTHCWTVHNAAKLKGNLYNYPRNYGPACGGGQPKYFYCYEARKN